MTKRLRMDTEDIVNRYVLVIDTETTGLPQGRNVTSETYKKWDKARLVQIAWELYNPSRECIQKECYIITPDNFEIPEVVVNIHGISTERAYNEGIALIDVLKKIHVILNNNPIIVAHNIQFDNDIILAELYRYQNKLTNIHYSQDNLLEKLEIKPLVIIPTSFTQKIGIENLITSINLYFNNSDKVKINKTLFRITRSFDINQPGIDYQDIKGGCVGGSLISGNFNINDDQNYLFFSFI